MFNNSKLLKNLCLPLAMNGIELDAVLSVDDVAVEYGLVLAVVPSVLMRIVHYRAAVSAVGTIVISRRLVCICENGRV